MLISRIFCEEMVAIKFRKNGQMEKLYKTQLWQYFFRQNEIVMAWQDILAYLVMKNS